ncbi:hypothetical protein PTI98_007153 [Pleurotus ostreatus]|nr:hypothetical protein PTI98_007153 [Pleurotus ostreatus]
MQDQIQSIPALIEDHLCSFKVEAPPVADVTITRRLDKLESQFIVAQDKAESLHDRHPADNTSVLEERLNMLEQRMGGLLPQVEGWIATSKRLDTIENINTMMQADQQNLTQILMGLQDELHEVAMDPALIIADSVAAGQELASQFGTLGALVGSPVTPTSAQLRHMVQPVPRIQTSRIPRAPPRNHTLSLIRILPVYAFLLTCVVSLAYFKLGPLYHDDPSLHLRSVEDARIRSNYRPSVF